MCWAQIRAACKWRAAFPHEYVMRMMRQGGALGTRGDAGSYVFTDRYCAQWTLMDMLQEGGRGGAIRYKRVPGANGRKHPFGA